MNMKIYFYVLTVLLTVCTSCAKIDSRSVLGVGTMKYASSFENSEKLYEDSSFVYNNPTISLKIVDSLYFTDVLHSANGKWRIMTPQWQEIGRFLDKGHSKGEFNSIPCVYSARFVAEKDTLYSYVYDFGAGRVYELNITETLADSCLSYRCLDYEVPKFLDQYIYINENEYMIRENTHKQGVLKRWTLYKDGKVLRNAALEQVNAISIDTNDHNVLAALSGYNEKHDVLVQAYMYFNIINIISLHSDKCLSICNGDSGIDLTGIINHRHGMDYYYDCKIYDDFFAVLCIENKSKPSVQMYDYEGNPIREYILAKPATCFDIDMAKGYLYSYNNEDGMVNRYKIEL